MHDGQVPCPFCGHTFSRVRYTKKTMRRRICTRCDRRFTTVEIFVEKPRERAIARRKELRGATDEQRDDAAA